ncbi:hypothetical protein [Streptomyces collinus]|uniref:hypothetical protein n=1 Tax=Streptomyces collinus TaxID=42684 RepID=UPI002942F210|nr:hypothetical protein [Streptomyces collinus]
MTAESGTVKSEATANKRLAGDVISSGLIGFGFGLLAVYLLVQSTWVLATGFRPHHSPLGIGWTAVTAAVMFALAVGKSRTGTALDNPVLKMEGRVTLIDGPDRLPSPLGFWLRFCGGVTASERAAAGSDALGAGVR